MLHLTVIWVLSAGKSLAALSGCQVAFLPICSRYSFILALALFKFWAPDGSVCDLSVEDEYNAFNVN